MSWLNRVRNRIPFLPKRETTPDNLWHSCGECGAMIFVKEYEENQRVCPRCDHHGRIVEDRRVHDRVRRVVGDRAQRGVAVGQVELAVPRRLQLRAVLGEHRSEVGADEPGRTREQQLHADATSISATATGRCSRSERHAASPITSGARASAVVTSGVRLLSIASTNASHSRM